MINYIFRKSLVIGVIILIVGPVLITNNNSARTLNKQLSPQQITEFDSSHILEMIEQVNKSVLRQYVQNIQDYGPHPTGSKVLDDVGEYLFDALSSLDLSVRYIPWEYKKWKDENIEATLPGKGPSDDIVIICAHYDSIPVSPGADDDGSGIAIVLMIAEIMSKYSFNNTVKFILFSGEEQGLFGSRAYAETARKYNENIIGVVSLDSVGYAITSDEGSHIRHLANEKSAWIVDISEEIATKYHDIIGMDIVADPYGGFSDHHSFVKEQFDATLFYRYGMSPYYHTSEDKIEHVNMSSLAKVCKLALGTICRMAEINSKLSEEDLKISIKGTILSNLQQFSIKIDNKKYPLNTVNVSIDVQMRYLFRNEIVSIIKGPYRIPCNWSFTKEIEDCWEFIVSGRNYPRCFFRLIVTVKGINDDVPVYLKCQTVGVVIKNRIFFMIPKL